MSATGYLVQSADRPQWIYHLFRVLNSNLNGDNIVSVKLETDEWMRVGFICGNKVHLSSMARGYIAELKRRCPKWLHSSVIRQPLCSQQLVDGFIDSGGYVRVIHGIEVDAVNPMCDQIHNLVYRVSDARVAHGIRIVLVAFHHG